MLVDVGKIIFGQTTVTIQNIFRYDGFAYLGQIARFQIFVFLYKTQTIFEKSLKTY